MTVSDQLYEFIPERFFVKNLKDNRIGHIKLAFVRETVNPLIIRSTDSEATVTLVTIDGRELVEIPPRKLKSREKLLGLMICREFGTVDDGVRYNSILQKNHLNNPNSILFGDSVTQSNDAAALPSRAIYDWAYSLRDVKDITDKLQHNATSEDGTILKDLDFNPSQPDGAKVASQALHQTEYVLPSTYFPHFITVDNITAELFIHLLSSVLNQHRYGAQTTVTANNMTNHLVAIGFADFEKPINSYTISKAWNAKGNNSKLPSFESVTEFVQDQMAAQYGSSLLSDKSKKKVIELVKWVEGLWADYEAARNGESNTGALSQVYSAAKASVDSYLKEIKMVSVSTGDDKAQKVQQAIEALKSEGKETNKESVLSKVFEGARKPTAKTKKEYEKVIDEHLAAIGSKDESSSDQD
jgi:CRISPR-associated protein Csc2